MQKSTVLPAGTINVVVTIFYGDTINPGSFQADLNGTLFTGFHTVAGTSENVIIPLSSGRNVLLLIVDGVTPDGRDRAVFDIWKQQKAVPVYETSPVPARG